jgi:hypothetical protein
MANGNIPRKHHYVSQFLLAGFTADGSKDGKLYVSDLIASAEILLPVLARRRWGLLVSPGISFICFRQAVDNRQAQQ